VIEYEELKRPCTELFKEGKVRISKIPYAPPIVYFRKSNVSIRLCIDYRAINEHTVKDSFSLPRIDDFIDQLKDATCITHLDNLISPERYKWLHAAHSQRAQPEAFTQDLLKLRARYHPRAKSLNPQGRELKLANHSATMPTLQQALERTFRSDKELFESHLKFSMSNGISYYSAFLVDEIFGAITDSFRYRWTGSCIANP